MASQGQLWLQLSGAAIAFLEMFAYMVAPFALLMLLALGGNGVAAAAKYLQLILFVNMWPLTAVMVNAYVKKVATADLDTWSTLNSQNNAVTWMGLPGLAETYSSYLSVASALYALIPVLTLFLMTQSIHPMIRNGPQGVIKIEFYPFRFGGFCRTRQCPPHKPHAIVNLVRATTIVKTA